MSLDAMSDELEAMSRKGSRRAAEYSNRSVDDLVSQFQTVITDAEELLRVTANYSADGFAAVRTKFQDKLSDAKNALRDVKGVVAERTERATAATEEYVTENPWRALAIVASLGILIGMIAARR